MQTTGFVSSTRHCQFCIDAACIHLADMDASCCAEYPCSACEPICLGLIQDKKEGQVWQGQEGSQQWHWQQGKVSTPLMQSCGLWVLFGACEAVMGTPCDLHTHIGWHNAHHVKYVLYCTTTGKVYLFWTLKTSSSCLFFLLVFFLTSCLICDRLRPGSQQTQSLCKVNVHKMWF